MTETIRKIWLLTEEAATVQALRETLADNERFALAGVCRDLGELGVRLELEPAEIVLVDVDPRATAMLDDLEPLINHHLRSRFAILASEQTEGFLLRAMRIGVRHVQPKNGLRRELMAFLTALTPTAHGAERPGELACVLSAGGGCGATTLAINLASQVRDATDATVLLADFDIHYGSVASYLGIEGDYGLHNVLAYGERMDTGLLQSTAVRPEERLHVLLSPAAARLSPDGPPQMEHLERLLACCKRAYGISVIDAPRLPLEVTLRIARACARVLLTLQPAVRDVHVVRRLLAALEQGGLERDRLALIVNRYHSRRSAISLSAIEAIASGCLVLCLPNDYAYAARAILEGRPLSRLGGRSPLKRELARLSDHLHWPMVGQPSPRET